MQAFGLEGHYGQEVPTDICTVCHVIWFDEFESVRLSGLGWVTLLRRMQNASVQPPGVLGTSLACPRCATSLKPVHNLTRFGRFAALECPKKHGHLQTFSLLLAERGLVRPLVAGDLETLSREKRDATCLNCGAAIDAASERCGQCDSPLVVIDMPRLMAALLVRHAEALPDEQAARVAWPCRGCGAPLEPTQSARCEHCHHQVVVPSFLDLRPLLDKVEPLLRAALPRAARAHGEKLRNLRGDAAATATHRYLRHLLRPDEFVPSNLGWAVLAGAVVLGAMLVLL